MSKTLSFNRMPRVLKALPQEEIQLPQPPTVNPPPKLNWFLLGLPLALTLVTVGVRVLQASSQSSNPSSMWMSLSFTLMSIGSAITSLVNTLSQRKLYKENKEAQEQEYAQVLAARQKQLEDARYQQSWILREADPELQLLLERALEHDPHLWERRPQDPDFMHVRVGTGNAPSSVVIKAPHPPMPDPRLEEAHRLEAEYSIVPGVPLTVDLSTGPLGIAGTLQDRLEIARALICNLVAHHSPDEMYLLAVFDPTRTEQWQWLKWLPHTYVLDPEIHVRYLANDDVSAKNLLDDLLEMLHQRQNLLENKQPGQEDHMGWPRIVLLIDEYSLVQNNPAVNLLLTEGPRLGATAIFMVDERRQVPMGCHTVAEMLGTNELECATAGVGGITFRA
ncbi:MAG: hypothetical protein JXA89_16135, partial [Anaerolineae bacterium]|nr:hypothetical protein [Anaerolineae bacterium]